MSTRVAILGVDGAARAVAEALSRAGADVVAVDGDQGPGVRTAASTSDAVADAEVVIAFAAPSLARRVAAEVAPLLRDGAVYADATRGTPGVKRAIGGLFPADAFADARVEVSTDDSSALRFGASGPGADRFVAAMTSLGQQADRISARTGDAAARTLLDALLEKELAAVVVDILWAAQSLQQQAWASEEILRRFDRLSADTVREVVDDLSRFGKRRQIEMMDVTEMLGETGYTSTLSDGVALTYSRLLHSVKIPFTQRR